MHISNFRLVLHTSMTHISDFKYLQQGTCSLISLTIIVIVLLVLTAQVEFTCSCYERNQHINEIQSSANV